MNVYATEETTHSDTGSTSTGSAEASNTTASQSSETHTTTAAESSHGSEESGGLAAFGLDPLAIGLQLGAFIVLFVLFRKFGLKKIVKTLDDRYTTIEESLENAKKIDERLASTKKEEEIILAEARKQGDEAIKNAKSEAKNLLSEAEKRASDKTDKMIEDAQNRIASDVKKAQKQLESQVKSLVADATEAIIGEKIDASKDSQLIDRAIKEAEK